MKLTPFAKTFIALVIVAVVGVVFYFRRHEIRAGLNAADRPSASAGPSDPLPDRLPEKSAIDPAGKGAAAPAAKPGRIVIGVNDFGGGYPLILANDGAQPGPKSLFAKAGVDVEVRLIRGSKERLKAFDDGEVHIMLLTLDYLANLAPLYKQKGIDLRSFLLVDWSRGNIGIAAKPQFKSIEELKTARIATTRNTPTHYLLLSLLEKSNLTLPEIEDIKSRLVWAVKTPDAGALFARGEVDAVAIWEPHLSDAISDGKGITLVTTETATNLVADVLFGRKNWLEENREVLARLTQTFFSAVDELNQDPARAIDLSAAAFGQKRDLVESTLKKIKPAQFADNRAFFGLETEECAYDHLFLEASTVWQREGLIKEGVPAVDSKWTKVLSALAPQYRDQKIVESFRFLGLPAQGGPSLLTKSISIYFGSGQSTLDANARKVLDRFAKTLAMFQNAFVQVEGNTDNVGNRTANVALSKSRAEAVIAYLVERYRFDRSRFVAIGNGPDRPVADNQTNEGREQNRRTDFKLIKNVARVAP